MKKVESVISHDETLRLYGHPTVKRQKTKPKIIEQRPLSIPEMTSLQHREKLENLEQLIEGNENAKKIIKRKINIQKLPKQAESEITKTPSKETEKDKKERSEKAREYIRIKKQQDRLKAKAEEEIRLRDAEKIANELKKLDLLRKAQREADAKKRKQIKLNSRLLFDLNVGLEDVKNIKIHKGAEAVDILHENMIIDEVIIEERHDNAFIIDMIDKQNDHNVLENLIDKPNDVKEVISETIDNITKKVGACPFDNFIMKEVHEVEKNEQAEPKIHDTVEKDGNPINQQASGNETLATQIQNISYDEASNLLPLSQNSNSKANIAAFEYDKNITERPNTTVNPVLENFGDRNQKIGNINKQLELLKKKLFETHDVETFDTESGTSQSALNHDSESTSNYQQLSECILNDTNEEVELNLQKDILATHLPDLGISSIHDFNLQQHHVLKTNAANKIRSFYHRYCKKTATRRSSTYTQSNPVLQKVKISLEPISHTLNFTEYDMNDDDFSPLINFPKQEDPMNILAIFSRKLAPETFNQNIPVEAVENNNSKPQIIEARNSWDKNENTSQVLKNKETVDETTSGKVDDAEIKAQQRELDKLDFNKLENDTKVLRHEEIMETTITEFAYDDDFASISGIESDIKENGSISDISIESIRDLKIDGMFAKPETANDIFETAKTPISDEATPPNLNANLNMPNNLNTENPEENDSHPQPNLYNHETNYIFPEKARLMGNGGKQLSPNSLSRKYFVF